TVDLGGDASDSGESILLAAKLATEGIHIGTSVSGCQQTTGASNKLPPGVSRKRNIYSIEYGVLIKMEEAFMCGLRWLPLSTCCGRHRQERGAYGKVVVGGH
ncbi:unnamed protein product, partial [Ectocarpus sp. 12 AP-2014]